LATNRLALQAQQTVIMLYPAARAGKEVTLSVRAMYRIVSKPILLALSSLPGLS